MTHRAPIGTAVRGALGPFDLEQLVARGAMGTVVRGHHRRSGLPVAVKLLDGVHATDKSLCDALIAEARRVAAIDHPHIVRALDLGRVGTDALVAAGAPLGSGSPFVVMEFASRGTLNRSQVPSWAELKPTLLALLEALALAHANDLFHLDLKPANVLLGCDRGDGSGADLIDGLRLADFGIAWQRFTTERTGISGTPSYMAPEQIRGEVARIGPWTDLYALGCMAWELVVGKPPHRGPSTSATFQAHLRGELPPFTPQGAWPSALPKWLATLLRGEARARPWSAAEAAESLRGISDAVSDVPAALWWLAADATTVERAEAARTLAAEADPFAPRPRKIPSEPPPIHRFKTPQPLADAGLAMLGLRNPTVAGRERERALCWEALRRTAVEARPHLLLLLGGVGQDPWRLARWLRVAASEAGLAWGYPLPADDQGAFRALTRALLPPQVLAPATEAARLLAATEPLERTALTSALAEAHAGERTLGDEAALVLRTAAALARGRPLLFEYNGASATTLEACEEILARGWAVRAPLLMVASVDADLIAGAAVVARLRGSDSATLIDVGDLEPEAMSASLTSLLSLSPEMTNALTVRAGGDLEAALSLLAQYHRLGELIPTSDGFARVGTADVAPEGPWDRWRPLLALVAPEPVQREALQRAATLGDEVDLSDWAGVQDLSGASVNLEALVGRLLDARLVRLTAGRFRFVHPALRDLLVREAPVGRQRELHAAAAAWYEARPDRDPDGERRGCHLLDAGYVTLGAPLVVAAASAALDRGRIREATLLYERLRPALERRLPGSPLWRRYSILRLRLLTIAGATQERLALAEAVIAAATAARDQGHRLRGEIHRVNALQILGRSQEASRHLDRALQEDALPVAEAADLFLLRAAQHLGAGDLPAAEALANQAWELGPRGAPPRALAQAAALGADAASHGRVAQLEVWLERLERALEDYPGSLVRVSLLSGRFRIASWRDLPAARALAPAYVHAARGSANRHMLGAALNESGWLHLATGDNAAARAAFEEADELYAAGASIDRINTLAGRVELARRDGRGDKLEHARSLLQAIDGRDINLSLRCIRGRALLTAAACQGDAPGAEACLNALEGDLVIWHQDHSVKLGPIDRARAEWDLQALATNGLGHLAERLAAHLSLPSGTR